MRKNLSHKKKKVNATLKSNKAKKKNLSKITKKENREKRKGTEAQLHNHPLSLKNLEESHTKEIVIVITKKEVKSTVDPGAEINPKEIRRIEIEVKGKVTIKGIAELLTIVQCAL